MACSIMGKGCTLRLEPVLRVAFSLRSPRRRGVKALLSLRAIAYTYGNAIEFEEVF